jgi:hypothetical protein
MDNDRIFVSTSYMEGSAVVAWAAASSGILSPEDRDVPREPRRPDGRMDHTERVMKADARLVIAIEQAELAKSVGSGGCSVLHA